MAKLKQRMDNASSLKCRRAQHRQEGGRSNARYASARGEHASLFLDTNEYLNKTAVMDEIDVVIKAYQLHLEQTQPRSLKPLLSVTRAWRLVKFVDNGMLTETRCNCCSGHYASYPHEIAKQFTCGLSNPPARAGKVSGQPTHVDRCRSAT